MTLIHTMKVNKAQQGASCEVDESFDVDHVIKVTPPQIAVDAHMPGVPEPYEAGHHASNMCSRIHSPLVVVHVSQHDE